MKHIIYFIYRHYIVMLIAIFVGSGFLANALTENAFLYALIMAMPFFAFLILVVYLKGYFIRKYHQETEMLELFKDPEKTENLELVCSFSVTIFVLTNILFAFSWIGSLFMD